MGDAVMISIKDLQPVMPRAAGQMGAGTARRGRPRKARVPLVFFSVGDVSVLLNWEADSVLGVLRDDGLRGRFFPGAHRSMNGEAEAWAVPLSDVMRWKGENVLAPLLRVSEVARRLSKPWKTVSRWAREGKLPSVVLPDGSLRVRSDLFLARLPVLGKGDWKGFTHWKGARA